MLDHVPEDKKINFLDSYLENETKIILTDKEKNIINARHEANKKPGKRNQELIDKLRNK